MRYLLLFASFTTGCVYSPRAVIEIGIIDWDLSLSDEIDTRGDPNHVNGMERAVRLEGDLFEIGPVVVDVGIGPHTFNSREHSGTVVGAEVASRIRIKATDWLEPYLIQVHGVDYFDQAWEPEVVNYGFTTQFGGGVRLIVSERLSINIDYRWWHNSWGKTFHGDWLRKTFNLANEGFNQGFESGAIFIGASYEF